MKHDLDVFAVLAKRRVDALSLFRARPGEQTAALKSRATEKLYRGGNRGGKSTTAAVEFAAIARDVPLYSADGEVIEMRQPWQKGRPLLMWVIGCQFNHAETIHRMLFRPGLFRIIRDRNTALWRAWNPLDPDDKAREAECKPSPPLIPPSLLKGDIGWVRKKSYEWDTCVLKDETTIKYYPSTAEAKQGDAVDIIWVDEQLANPDHYYEYKMRLIDRKGRVFWSSKPYKSNMALYDLSERAAKQREELKHGLRQTADVEEFVFTQSGNPYIDDDEKRKALDGLPDSERRMRDLGEFVLDEVLIYPNFNPYIHCAYGPNSDNDDDLAACLRERGGIPPEDWTRELVLDPGTANPCILLCAVPPRQFWIDASTPYYVVYDEIYPTQKDADWLAREVRTRSGAATFQRFIIDGNASRQRPMGFSGTIGWNYSRAFENYGLRCVESGTLFTPGDPDFSSRSMIVNEWLRVRGNGRAQLRIVLHRCPGLVDQMQRNTKSCNGDAILDRPNPRQKQDARCCLEYWASRRPRYVPPPKREEGIDPYVDQFQKWLERSKGSSPSSGVATLGITLTGV